MKFICTDDWHIRNSTPRHRVDNFTETQMNKIAFIIELALKRNAWILIAGDIFNSAKEPYKLIWEYKNYTLTDDVMDLVSTATQKAIQYRHRESGQFDPQPEHYKRAVDVIEYAYKRRYESGQYKLFN